MTTPANVRFYNAEYHEVNADNLRIIHTSNAGDRVVPGATPTPPAYFGFACPRGKRECNYLRIRGGPADKGDRPTWEWDGNRERPTFKPSINCLAHNPLDASERYAGCGWHAWITNGECT